MEELLWVNSAELSGPSSRPTTRMNAYNDHFWPFRNVCPKVMTYPIGPARFFFGTRVVTRPEYPVRIHRLALVEWHDNHNGPNVV